jgi:hypothetical protein
MKSCSRILPETSTILTIANFNNVDGTYLYS